MSTALHTRLLNEALAIEAEAAREAGALGFMARAMVQATMPHRRQDGNEFTRTNGLFTLSMLSPSAIGLPYGSIPRLLVSWVTTEAVRTKSRELELGESLSAFMADLGLAPTGGRWGTITRLKDQMRRLFASSITCSFDDGQSWALDSVKVVESARLWWNPKDPQQATLWKSSLKLGESFFGEVIAHPVPVDMRALKALKSSPMALDLYCWLTYRASYLRKQTMVPWEALRAQFGADFADTASGRQGFRLALTRALAKVAVVYPDARVEAMKPGLLLRPSRSHVLP